MFTPPRILAAVLVALYLAFLAWFGGHGQPMTPEETERLFALIAERAKNEPNPDGHLRDHLRALAASDDGKEFYMVNLIRFRPKAVYPPGHAYDDDALAADARYNRVIVPYLLRHGGVPVFLSKPQGRFLDEPGDTEWHRVAIVRYRSRRDLLEMVVDLAGQNVGVHKWASIEKTQVFPVRPLYSLVFARGFVAALLALVGLMLHLALRRTGWYGGAHKDSGVIG